MAQLGHEVTVITTSADGMPDSFQTDEGVRVYQAPIGNLHWYFHKTRLFPTNAIHFIKIWEVGRALTNKAIHLGKKNTFDIIEVGPPAAWLYPALQKLEKTKIVMTLHGSRGLDRSTNPHKQNIYDHFWLFAERKAAHTADCLVAPSRYVADYYEHEYHRRPEIIPLPVYTVHKSEMPPPPLRILTLAAISPGKGAGIIPTIVQETLKSKPGIQFTLVAATGKPDFENLASSYSPQQVEILPWLPPEQFQKKLSDSHIYLATSQFETFGLSVAEAMACGKAVIASDIPAHRELLGDNDRGILFRLDSPEELFEKIINLCQSVDLIHLLGKKAKDWAAEHLDPLQLSRRRIDLYTELFL